MFEKPAEENLHRRVSKTVLKTAEKGRRSLFETLTSANAEKLAEIMKNPPVFYENKEDAPRQIFLDNDISGLMPEEFFKDPTKWIESQEFIQRGDNQYLPKGQAINELWQDPYDVSKVRQFTLDLDKGKKLDIVSKRIKPDELEEVALARKAFEAGIPTPKALGEVMDKGNNYAFFEKLPAINLSAINFDCHGQIDHQFYDYPDGRDFFKDASELDKRLNNLPWKLSDNIKSIIHNNFNEVLPFAKCFEALHDIKSLIEKVQTPRQRSDKDGLIKDIEFIRSDFKEYNFNEIFSTILKPYRFENLDKLLSFIHLFSNKPEILKELYSQILNELENYSSILNNCRLKIFTDLRNDFFGFNIDQEVEDLKKLCDSKNIKHKDFNDRNILVSWDFEQNRPLTSGINGQRLFVIDWEQKEYKKS